MSEGSTSGRFWHSNATVTSSVKALSATAVASGVVLAIGIVLRLREVLGNRSLSQDEAQLALNIIDRPIDRLFGQLDFNQAAPQGFLVIQKLVSEVFGDSEYSLRLFPFVAGTLSLVLVFFLARAVVSPFAVPLAVGLFAVSEPLISYTTSSKQYGIDVLMSVAVLLIGARLIDHPGEPLGVGLFAGVGAAAVWLSHPAVFVLAGVSTALVASPLARRQWRKAIHASVPSLSWLASFALFATTSLDDVEGVQQSLSGTPGAFAGSGSTDSEALGTAVRTSLGAFRYISGIPHFLERGSDDAGELIALVVAAFCLVGLVSVSRRSWEKALALSAPLGFMLIAWALDQYPLLGRTQLFLAPIYVLLLGEGVAYLVRKARRPETRVATIVAAGIVGATIVAPAARDFVNPRPFHEMKPVLEHIATEQQPGDTVYVYYTAQPQLRYYLECGCAGPRFEAAKESGLWPLRRGPGGSFQWAPALMSAPPRLLVAQHRDSDSSSFGAHLDKLRGQRRVWVLLPEVEESKRTTLLQELDRRGTRRSMFAVGDPRAFASAVVVYLYDMTRPTITEEDA